MHLVWFHRVLIGVAIAFFAGFGLWELARYRDGAGIASLLFGLGSLAIAVGLGFYLRRLRRFLRLPD